MIKQAPIVPDNKYPKLSVLATMAVCFNCKHDIGYIPHLPITTYCGQCNWDNVLDSEGNYVF